MVIVAAVVVGAILLIRGDGGRSNRAGNTEANAGSAGGSQGSDSGPGPGDSAGGTDEDRGARGQGADDSRGGTGEPVLRDAVVQMGVVQREYLVLSPSWAEEKRLPLVLALHGMTVDRHAMLAAADWRAAVEERGFVAVFPQGMGNSWNVGPCCPPANILQVDDVGFLDAVIQAVKGASAIDDRRVFVTGFSAGALMTYRYACERADRLAGVAPMAGVNLTGCSPSSPLSLLHQHSDPDLVVPFDGGLGLGQLVTSEPLPSVDSSVSSWARADGCSDPLGWEPLSAGVDRRVWPNCASGTRVELVRLSGLGHEWPRTSDYDGLATMLDFFGIN